MEELRVLSQEMLTEDISSLWVEAPWTKKARAGQFVSFYPDDPSKLLPRPISICDINTRLDAVRFVYRVVGGGTQILSRLKTGDCIRTLGPLGNGFPLKEAEGKRVLLVGGGLGVPPMLGCAHLLRLPVEPCAGPENPVLPPKAVSIAVGYRRDLFLYEELKEAGAVYVSTDDGSFGVHGTVVDAIRTMPYPSDVVFACGPKPMLRAAAAYAREKGIPCWVSMEERMACGIGACLACVCKTKTDDPHYGVPYRRICKDGPVFNAEDLAEL